MIFSSSTSSRDMWLNLKLNPCPFSQSGHANLASLVYLVLALSCLSAYLLLWLPCNRQLIHTPIFNHSPVCSCASQHCYVASHIGNPSLHSSLSRIRPQPYSSYTRTPFIYPPASVALPHASLPYHLDVCTNV